jgi:hypothetical protein
VHSCNCSAAAFTYNKPVCRGRHWRNRRNNPKEVVYTQKKKKKKKKEFLDGCRRVLNFAFLSLSPHVTVATFNPHELQTWDLDPESFSVVCHCIFTASSPQSQSTWYFELFCSNGLFWAILSYFELFYELFLYY